jgi:hypothetical protein
MGLYAHPVLPAAMILRRYRLRMLRRAQEHPMLALWCWPMLAQVALWY